MERMSEIILWMRLQDTGMYWGLDRLKYVKNVCHLFGCVLTMEGSNRCVDQEGVCNLIEDECERLWGNVAYLEWECGVCDVVLIMPGPKGKA